MRRRSAPPPSPLAAFARPIALTRAAMVLERGLRAFWPLLSVCALCFAALAFGLWRVLDPLGQWLALSVAGLAVLAAAGFGLWRFRWPSRAAAVARLDATLPGRPLTALVDGLALGAEDPAAAALWQVHLRRMMRLAQGARAVAPAPDLARRDPFGLRLTAAAALVLALIFGAPIAGLSPGPVPATTGPAQAALGPSWEGWAEPPRYTRKPGLYLNSLDTAEITVPEGTRFAFRFYGSEVPFTESVSSPAAPPQAASDDAVPRRDFEAVRSGVIEIGGPLGRGFRVTVLPDAAPSVMLLGVAERRADGKMAQPFHAMDDYAVVSGHARITLDLAAVPRRYGLRAEPEPREDLVFDLPMPFSGSRADFTEQIVEDASKHPWANLPVKLTLEVEDGGLSDALQAMQQAQQRLSEAIRNGASKDEVAKLMQELKEATDRYLQMLAERGQQQEQGPQFGQQQQQGQQITGDQIQQMMDEIQKLMNEGRMAEAQELLDQLARLMENLKVTQGQGGEGGPGSQAMRDLGQTLRDQQQLSDDAFRGMQQQPGDGQQPGEGTQGQQPGSGQGQGQGPGQGEGQGLAERQGALRRELDRQRGLLPQMGGEQGEAARRQLDEAGRAMEGAEQALRQGDNGTALDQQADAIEALREGMRNLRDALAQEGGQNGERSPGEGAQRTGDAMGGQPGRELPRDPLGRATGEGAQIGSERNMLQGEDVYRRARDLLDEIRRRSADRLRSAEELDYLRRLLDRF